LAYLESLLHFLEEVLELSDFPDYSNALNGLQVGGPEEIRTVAAAVDASEETILEAVEQGAQLLVVHHGLFWDGLGPLTGPRLRKVKALIQGRLALFSAHLPLDAHPEVGNCALLTRALGLEPQGRFGSFQGVEIGWWAHAGLGRQELEERLREAVEGSVRLIPGGGETVDRVGVLTGGGASTLREAEAAGLDAVITGEAAHQHYHEALERRVNLYLGGHYATETFGVKALARRLAEEFELEWEFIHVPTGF